jgi:hypothetical protein
MLPFYEKRKYFLKVSVLQAGVCLSRKNTTTRRLHPDQWMKLFSVNLRIDSVRQDWKDG